jgi:hypothetical protein
MHTRPQNKATVIHRTLISLVPPCHTTLQQSLHFSTLPRAYCLSAYHSVARNASHVNWGEQALVLARPGAGAPEGQKATSPLHQTNSQRLLAAAACSLSEDQVYVITWWAPTAARDSPASGTLPSAKRAR